MADDASERTEEATPKKREEARREGQVVKSTEVSSVVSLLAGILLLSLWGPSMMTEVIDLCKTIFRKAGTTPIVADALRPHFMNGFVILSKLLGPMMLALMVVGVGINIAQVGFLFTFKTLKPKLKKFNPIKGLQQIVSKDTFVGLIREPLKVIIIGGVGYYVIRKEYEDILLLPGLELPQIISFLGDTIIGCVASISIALIGLAILDYAYRWWKHERDLRMTKQDVRDETKHQEGNQEMKAKMRSQHSPTQRKRMLDAVPEADVVITNPTHLAVALRYNADESESPKVVAKGARLIAKTIIAIARENDVPVVENKPVARALYKTVEVDQEIPIDLYQAVAEILAFVYQLKGKQPAGSDQVTP